MIAFGLFNRPTSFKDYINKILAEKKDIYVIIYYDNIMIYIDKLEYINSI